MAAVVVPLVRDFFYVTNTQPLKATLVFFRKPVWRCLETSAIDELRATIYKV
jgi:hypothetical protein